MAKIALTTLGCKVNWADGEGLIRQFAGMGLQIVSFDSIADVYVINSCTVTEVADSQSRQMIRRAKRLNPDALIVATGCMAEVGPDEIAQMPDVDAVFGTHDRQGIVEFLSQRLGVPCVKKEVTAGQSRARAFVKIQDGCDRACAYCIVPRARGPARSVLPDQVISACMEYARYHREIVFTGIDIGQYGSDLKEYTSLVDLIRVIIGLNGIPRIRLSSVDPTIVDDKFVGLFSNADRLCRHVHLSIQSGSDSVLERMGRQYTTVHVREAAQKLIEAVPDIAITGDIIAGFPGETDKEHQETLALVRALPFASLHVFPYSMRKETRASFMKGHVNPDVKKGRAVDLRKAAEMHRRQFLAGLKGKLLDVIVTSRAPDSQGFVQGFSDNAVSVALPSGFVDYAGLGLATITQVNDLKVQGTWGSR